MKLNLNLGYRVQPDDLLAHRLLDLEDLEALEEKARDLLKAKEEKDITAFTREAIARRCQEDLIKTSPDLMVRVSAKLLRDAINVRFIKEVPGQGRVLDMPRDKKNKRNPGVWWGDIDDNLYDCPAALELSVERMTWFVEVWTDDKVQNGLTPSQQRWMNVLDKEFERVSAELSDPAAEVKAETKAQAPAEVKAETQGAGTITDP